MPLTPALAMTADQAFADGNRLFRDDLYWAALLRYRQAREAGMDTPALHYNTGVAHYKAGQHIRARTSLLRATESPGLRVITHFNLGLNAYAAGDVDDALDWFRRARDQEQDRKIRRLAIIAISRLQTEQREADPILMRAEKREEEKKFTNFDLRARIGFGNDDNVFRTPGQDYVDLSNPNLPLITPEAISGAYLPVDVSLRYNVNSLKFESFYGGYRLSGRYYQDEELDNANEFSHEVRFGSEYAQTRENWARRVHSAFTIAQHDETYFDPDDGAARAINGELIDDRLNYVRYGPQIEFRQSYDKLSYGLRLKGQLWNYEETELVPEYDHEYFLFGGNIQYRFTPTALLRLTLAKYSRRYGDRPSFDLNGQQPITNPTVRYDYLEAGITARQRITRGMWFGINYLRTDRTDRFLGYNDFTRDHFGMDFHLRVGRRFAFETSAYYRIYDYVSAFAFHNPVAPRKTLETLRGKLKASYQISSHLSIVADAELRESTSTDTRIEYDRTLYSLGVTWEM